MKIWYAVLTDNNDNDWGTGSAIERETVEMARKYRENGYPDAYVAIIADSADPVCIGEIRDI